MSNPSRFRLLLRFVSFLLIDWQSKLRLALTGLFLLQFIEWFDEFLLKDTSWLVRASMVVFFIAELFSRVRPIWRRSAALLAILLLHDYRLQIDYAPVPTGKGWGTFVNSLGTSISDAAAAFTPYIWFSAGACAVYLLTAYLFKERARIILLVVLSVVLFALIDSYSKIVMWDQVGYIVFAGLGLIILEHFEHFRQKHPSSWAYLAEYPGQVALPIVIIVSLVMLAGSIAPNARPLLTDPYTLYKHWQGEKVITGGKGFAKAGGDEEFVDAFNHTSGYGRDDGALGSGFNFDYSEVMRVTTTQRSYWRGETKSLYTGEGWVASDADLNTPLSQITAGEKLPDYDWGAEPAGETVQVKQLVQITADKPEYPVLFGAYPIQSVEAVGQAVDGESKPSVVAADWSEKQGEIRWDKDQPYPASYEIVSALPVTNLNAWKNAPAGNFSGREWRQYLQLPDTLPQRVRDLARDVTEDAATPYEKVKSIESYLQLNFTYNNLPDLSKGKSADFVDRFLFEMQEGYCDYFSSAMAIMVRSVGLPARWVKGFKSGVLDIELMFPAGNIPEEIARNMAEGGEGTYVVRNSDAHSWVEVYFPGFGWLPFEPTSGMSMPLVNGADGALEASAEVAIDPIAEDAESDGSFFERLLTPVYAITAAAVLIVLAALAWLLRKFGLGWIRIFFIRRGAKEEHSLNQQALAEIGRIFKLFKRRGYLRGAHETARESFARWTEQNRWLKKDLDVLLSVFERARYSPQGISSDDMVLVIKTRQKLKEELKG